MTPPTPTSPPTLPGPQLRARLQALLAQAQHDWRAPGVSAAVVRDGALVWSSHVGAADLEQGRPATDDTAYLIGSVTKTFTAVLVMALRDEGRLDLDRPVAEVIPELPAASSRLITPRRLLAHASGLQREFAGRVWEALDMPDDDRLLAELADARSVLPPHLFHYSNLGFALLGQVVARLDGGSWAASLQRRVLDPLGMTSTGLQPAGESATGYLVHPNGGTAAREPTLELRASAPSGGLWSTIRDLARYAAFLADPAPQVLAPETLEEMVRPAVMVDLEEWTAAQGLGLSLARVGERVLVGHAGAMPGFLTGLRVHRRDGVGAVVLVNSGAGADPLDLAASLVLAVLDAEPAMPAPWAPSRRHPELDGILGNWWTEGEEIVFEVREDQLWARLTRAPAGGSETRFAQESADAFRAVEGRERGELLEVVRDEQGRVERMYFVTYPVTREPQPFGGEG